MDHRTQDIDLSSRIAAGDANALAEAYDCHAAAVHGVAWRILCDPNAAEDVVQDVFLRLWERPRGYDPRRGPLRAWLCAVARYRAIDRVRRTARHVGVLRTMAGGQPTSDDTAEPIMQDGLAKAVRAAVETLPPTHRTAIVLAYYGGLSYRQVAVTLGIPEGTAKSRLRLGLRRIGAYMAAEGWLD